MAPPTQSIWPLKVLPGIKRDGTELEGNYWTDGIWTRFQRGLPRSIGGYQRIVTGFSGPSRQMHVYCINGYTRVHSGYASGIEVCSIDQSGSGGGISDRTPVGFATSTDNIWQFDIMYNAAGTNAVLIGHGAPNLTQIDSDTATEVWYGDINATTALVTTGQSVSGGACVLHPYLFAYGSAGSIAWSDANSPTNFATGDAGSARVAEGKIVKGMVSRGGSGNAPAGLFWTLNSLVRASFVGSTAIFRFDTISDQTSILSSSGVIEYDGLYFWPAVDRFLMYNGMVRELPNSMNLNYFFDNLNRAYSQKVHATKVPRYGEIWWFFPSGTATECNDAIIYNVRENIWYDVGQAVGAKRSAAYFPQVFPNPLMITNTADSSGKYSLYRHETGTDDVGDQSNAILSAVESCDIGWCADGPALQGAGIENWMRVERVEPDFVMTGDMTMTVKGRRFPQSTENTEDRYDFTPTTEKIDPREQRRLMRLRFESNVAGGSWQMGELLCHWKLGDGRP